MSNVSNIQQMDGDDGYTDVHRAFVQLMMVGSAVLVRLISLGNELARRRGARWRKKWREML